MTQIPQTISVTDLRSKTKEVIQKVMKNHEPLYILYNSQMPVCIVSTDWLSSMMKEGRELSVSRSLDKYRGFLQRSKVFSGNAVAYQRKLRSEWDRK